MTLFKYATPIPFTDLGKLEVGLTDLRLDRSRVLNSLNSCSNVHVDVKSEIKKEWVSEKIFYKLNSKVRNNSLQDFHPVKSCFLLHSFAEFRALYFEAKISHFERKSQK